MDDKNLMENVLLLEKGVCDLFLHGTIEASSPEVHQAFNSALNCALGLQSDVYQEMAAKGWYAPEQAQQAQRSQLKQKYAQGISG